MLLIVQAALLLAVFSSVSAGPSGQCSAYRRRATKDDEKWQRKLDQCNADACPSDYTYAPYPVALCYKVVDDTENFTDAEAVCQAEGGRLVILDTIEKFNLVNGIALTNSFSVWVGGTIDNGELVWSNGDTIQGQRDICFRNFDLFGDCFALFGIYQVCNCLLISEFICEIPLE